MIDTHQEFSQSDDYDLNIALTYKYVEESVKALQENIKNLNTRLGLIIGFDAGLIRLASELPSKYLKCHAQAIENCLLCYSCFFLKLIVIVLFSLSIGVCSWYVFPKGVSSVIFASELLDKAQKNSNRERPFNFEMQQTLMCDYRIPHKGYDSQEIFSVDY